MTINELERQARRGVEMEIPQAQDMLDLIADWRRMQVALEFYVKPWEHCEFVPDFYNEMDFGDVAGNALAALKCKE